MLQVLETIKQKVGINLLPVRLKEDDSLPESVDRQEFIMENGLILDDRLRVTIKENYAEGKRDFRGQDWSQQDLSGLDLSGCDLRGVNLFGASLRGVNLSQVDLQGANCNRVNFRYSLLKGVICPGVAFDNCLFERARISKGNWVGATVLNGRFLRTLWHSNKIDVSRFSPNGINLYGVLNSLEIEKICEKKERERRKIVFAVLILILFGFLQISSSFVWPIQI